MVSAFDDFVTEDELEHKKQEGKIMGEAIRTRLLNKDRTDDDLECSDPMEKEFADQNWYHDFYVEDYYNEMAYVYEELDQEYAGAGYDYMGETMEEYTDYGSEVEEYYGE